MASIVNVMDVSSAPINAQEVHQALFDSGANCCVTNHFKDFFGNFECTGKDQIVDGIGKGPCIEGSGAVGWMFIADNGMHHTLRVPCHHISSANTHVASVHIALKACPNKKVCMDQESWTLSGHKNNPSVTVLNRPTCRDTG